jgi:hypothetical protein
MPKFSTLTFTDADARYSKLIETISGASTTYDFDNIPATFSCLRLVICGRSNVAATNFAVTMTLNGDSGNNYDRQFCYSSSTTLTGAGASAQASMQIGSLTAATASADMAGSITVDFPAYANTTFNKTAQFNWTDFRTLGTTSSYEIGWGAGAWRSTAAINRIVVSTGFVAGSSASLYGLP